MLIRYGYELTFNCAEPALMVCLLDAHRDQARNIRYETPFETTPAISTETYLDTFGNHVRRFIAPAGDLTIRRACACRSERRLAKTRVSIWPTVGSVSRARCRITPSFRRTPNVAFVTATLPAAPRWPAEPTEAPAVLLADDRRKNGEIAWHSDLPTSPPDPRHRNVGNAGAAQLDRNLNHAHKIWL